MKRRSVRTVRAPRRAKQLGCGTEGAPERHAELSLEAIGVHRERVKAEQHVLDPAVAR